MREAAPQGGDTVRLQYLLSVDLYSTLLECLFVLYWRRSNPWMCL